MTTVQPPQLVVIGTSLGGLRALTAVLGHLPQGFAVPIALVQHRGLDGTSRGLGAILQERTPLTVVEAEDKMALRPGTVYLAPADYHLLVEARGVLALSTDAPVRSARPSIDVLFQTAAEAYGPALLGVLLTGASADGAQGLTAIKLRGGRTIVEDPLTAESGTMPAAGIAATKVDYVLPLERIGRSVASLSAGTPV